MKLEGIYDEAIFIAPKVYGAKSSSNQSKIIEFTKCKGAKNIIPYSILKNVLNGQNKVQIEQEKWYRSMQNGQINIVNEIYTIMKTENKRTLIYEDGTTHPISTKSLFFHYLPQGCDTLPPAPQSRERGPKGLCVGRGRQAICC